MLHCSISPIVSVRIFIVYFCIIFGLTFLKNGHDHHVQMFTVSLPWYAMLQVSFSVWSLIKISVVKMSEENDRGTDIRRKMPKVSPRHFLFMELIDTEFCLQNLREHPAAHKMGALAFFWQNGCGGMQIDACAFCFACMSACCVCISPNLSFFFFFF